MPFRSADLNYVVDLVEGERVLSIGAIGVDFLLKLVRSGKSVTVVDTDCDWIEDVRQLVIREAPDLQQKLQFEVSDIHHARHENAPYDALILFCETGKPEDIEACLETATASLKRDGHVFQISPFGFANDPERTDVKYLSYPVAAANKWVSVSTVKVLSGHLLLAGSRRRVPSKRAPSFKQDVVATLEAGFESIEKSLLEENRHLQGMAGSNNGPQVEIAQSLQASLDAQTLATHQAELQLNDCSNKLNIMEAEQERLRNHLALVQQEQERDQRETLLLEQAIKHAMVLLNYYDGMSETEQQGPRPNALSDALLLRLQKLLLNTQKRDDELKREQAIRQELAQKVEHITRELQSLESRRQEESARAEHNIQTYEQELKKLNSECQVARDKANVLARDLGAVKKTSDDQKNQLDQLRPALEQATAQLADKADLARRLSDTSAALQNARTQQALIFDYPFTPRSLRREQAKGRKIRMAGIMDEFTTASFTPECNFLPLDPDCWRDQLIDFRPDLVFIESAWHGNGGKWNLKVSTYSEELEGVLLWCKASGTPAVFWNKEDPVHFSVFQDVAAKCDAVFTTDLDCVPAYKHNLGHDRVYYLPFAAQPKVHNPIEKYDRKDAFNFAGSYYLRYPERQRDFATLIDTLKEIKPVEIYDRNFENEHPHYIFPEEYQTMILGSLPFSEIDKAYKGYRYGINMNTIKQSQTMFARRVFEMMASNTVVVSNFSRGVRQLFGDLVICSDDGNQIAGRLAPIVEDETYFRKFRLAALRKVMSEHTYRSRLNYILAKVTTDASSDGDEMVAIVAAAKTPEAQTRLIESWCSQTHQNKRLYLLAEELDKEPTLDEEETPQSDIPQGVYLFHSAETLIESVLAAAEEMPFFGTMSASDYYGPNYLTDLILADRYSDADGFGKACHYMTDSNNNSVLTGEEHRYRFVDQLSLRTAILRSTFLNADILKSILQDPDAAEVSDMRLLSLDEFNYFRSVDQLSDATARAIEEQVGDIKIQCQGSAVSDVIAAAESLPAGLPRRNPSQSNLPTLSIDHLSSYMKTPAEAPLKTGKTADWFIVTSTLAPNKHSYLWMNRKLPRTELNLVDNSTIFFDFEANTEEAHFVCEFYTKDNRKISHSMLPKGGVSTLAIPNECTHLRFGLRLRGSGTAKISKIVFGSVGQFPPVVVGKTDTLVLTKQYPSYNDLYKYGFLHSRIRGYRREGVEVDIFRLNTSSPQVYDEFENFDVSSGDATLLDATLQSGQYRHVLVHLLDRNMWNVLRRYLDKIQITVWIHGAEIQAWQRREFEFERMSEQEIDRQKRLSDDRMKLWNEVFSTTTANLHHVFVSRHFMNEIIEDVGRGPNEGHYSIIHNHIDGDIFKFVQKDKEQRKKILSIRPYSSRKYANDLSVAAILELSKRPVFQALSFYLAGEGELFDTLTAPLKDFPNVTLRNEFLTHVEIAALHKKYGIFLTPTRMDSQGVSRDEAMSSGLVPITTKVAAIPEFVDRGSGILVPPEDPKALADAIEDLYNKPQEFLRRSAGAAQRVRQQSGFSQTIAREIELIRKSE